MNNPVLGFRLAEFPRAVAAKEPAPGGGTVDAMTTAAAAGLVAMAARFSPLDYAADRLDAIGNAADRAQARVNGAGRTRPVASRGGG